MPANIPEPVKAAEKTAEHDLKQPSGLNWLAVFGAAIVANLIGVVFRV